MTDIHFAWSRYTSPLGIGFLMAGDGNSAGCVHKQSTVACDSISISSERLPVIQVREVRRAQRDVTLVAFWTMHG